MAVLAAVTEIIKEQGGKETETEYFAALMSALEVTMLCMIFSLWLREPVPIQWTSIGFE